MADFSLLVDPPTNRKGGLVLLTESEAGNLDSDENEIKLPGEYEVSGIRVKGVSVDTSEKTVKVAYSALFDGIRLGFLNGIDKELSQNVLDSMGEIDILFVNIEKSELNSKEMSSFIKKIEPKIVVPTTDKGAKKLLEEFGQKGKAEEKLTLKAKDLNEEEGMKVVWLKV